MDSVQGLIVANFVLPIIKDLVTPKINSVLKTYTRNKYKSDNLSSRFNEYLSQRYEKYFLLDTLVFPNKQTLLKKLYEPLTLVCRNSQAKSIEIKIDNYPKELLPDFYRVIIEDTAGMGKSTIIKRLFLSIIEEKIGIPILVELRKLSRTNTMLSEINLQLSPMGDNIDEDVLINLIREGQFIFLFDGFDEIPLLNRDFVINDLHNFIEKANNNYFIITSRPEDSLVSFGDFQKFSVRPLSQLESSNLIKRYDYYSFKSISNDLIKLLVNGQNNSIDEFLTNPFLVSLLYKSFEYKKDIPIKKSQFYSQIYDALFEMHDLSKEGYLKREKYSNLHIDDFERVLRYLGYFTAIENKVEYDKNYIINLIDKLKIHFNDLSFKASDFLKDLLETVPLFRKDGNYYKWSHKSLQDYFASKFIWIDSKENQVKILRKIFDDKANERFYNLLDIYYELDTKSFNYTILMWFLSEFKEYAINNYKKFPSVDDKFIKKRIEFCFNNIFTIVVTKLSDYEQLKIGGPSKKSKEIEKYYSSKVNHRFRGIWYYYFKDPRVVVLKYHNANQNNETILKILNHKKIDIFKYIQHKIDFDKLILLKEDTSYHIDYELDNILNTPDIFDLVNSLLSNNVYSIDYDKCINRLTQLEKEKLANIENDLLNW